MKNKHSFLTDKSIASLMLPSFSTQDLFYLMNKRSKYLTNLKNAVDNFKAKQTLIDARADNIKRQQLMNYQGEYDRIVAALNHSAYRGLNNDMLKNRLRELKALGKNGIKDTAIYDGEVFRL